MWNSSRTLNGRERDRAHLRPAFSAMIQVVEGGARGLYGADAKAAMRGVEAASRTTPSGVGRGICTAIAGGAVKDWPTAIAVQIGQAPAGPGWSVWPP